MSLSDKAWKEIGEVFLCKRKRVSPSVRLECRISLLQMLLPVLQFWEEFWAEYGSALQSALEATNAQSEEQANAIHE